MSRPTETDVTRIKWLLPEFGRCLRHGYVEDRCCKGWKPLPKTTYLRDAMRATLRRDR